MGNPHRPKPQQQDAMERMSADFAQAIKRMQENVPAMLEYAKLQATLAKAKFDALKAEGFTDAQAIELTKETMR